MGNRIGGKRKVSFPFFLSHIFLSNLSVHEQGMPDDFHDLVRLLSPARLIFTILAVALLQRHGDISADDLKLWYDKPAANWEQQALPIGNGRLGAMIFGGVPEEHIQFNEESLWIGAKIVAISSWRPAMQRSLALGGGQSECLAGTKSEPNAPPVIMIGPSAPNGPPVPMENAEDNGFSTATLKPMRLCPMRISLQRLRDLVPADLFRTITGH